MGSDIWWIFRVLEKKDVNVNRKARTVKTEPVLNEIKFHGSCGRIAVTNLLRRNRREPLKKKIRYVSVFAGIVVRCMIRANTEPVKQNLA